MERIKMTKRTKKPAKKLSKTTKKAQSPKFTFEHVIDIFAAIVVPVVVALIVSREVNYE
jgi:hypothetical protein